jgi:hypothetical protein
MPKPKKIDGRGKIKKALCGKALLKSCSRKGIISTNCYFKLYMGFDDSKMSLSKKPICEETKLIFNQNKNRIQE